MVESRERAIRSFFSPSSLGLALRGKWRAQLMLGGDATFFFFKVASVPLLLFSQVKHCLRAPRAGRWRISKNVHRDQDEKDAQNIIYNITRVRVCGCIDDHFLKFGGTLVVRYPSSKPAQRVFRLFGLALGQQPHRRIGALNIQQLTIVDTASNYNLRVSQWCQIDFCHRWDRGGNKIIFKDLRKNNRNFK